MIEKKIKNAVYKFINLSFFKINENYFKKQKLQSLFFKE